MNRDDLKVESTRHALNCMHLSGMDPVYSKYNVIYKRGTEDESPKRIF